MRKRTKRLRMSPGLRSRLDTVIIQNRRDTLYKIISKKCDGTVPCYVCGLHVDKKYASVEHILFKSQGGTDDMSNLWISHIKCNQKRSDNSNYPCNGIPNNIKIN